MGRLTYADAGVDLARHRRMHAEALRALEALARKLGADVAGLGGFAPSVRAFGRRLVLHVDGVGTKTMVLRRLGAMRVAGWDCVAMNANDVACEGGRLVAIADYVAMDGADEESFRQIIEGMVEAAGAVGAPIVSGETAILPGMLSGIDVVCFALAVLEGDFVNRAGPGDLVVGVESWGLHANGYSLVRRVVEERIGDYRSVVDGVDLAAELTKPTALYYDLLLEAVGLGYVTSATHVTGGGWTKMRRVLGGELDAELEAPRPGGIFEVIMSRGDIDPEEAYRTFNMGVGLILTSPRDRAPLLVELAERAGFRSWILGRVVEGSGSIRVRLGWRSGERIEI